MRKLKKAVGIILFFGCIYSVSAQKDFYEGYVVTNTNDTLYGLVKDRKTGPFSGIYDKIRFRGEGKRKRFSPKEIQAYKIGDRLFRSMFFGDEMTFLKVVTESYVNFYVLEFQEQGGEFFNEIEYLQKEGSPFFVRATLGLFGLRRKKLAQFFSDCPPLVEKIRNKEVKYVYEVVDFYNDWKQKEGNP